MDHAPSTAPPAYAQNDPYALGPRRKATFAQVATPIIKSIKIPSEFYAALDSFRDFMSSEEGAKISKSQLGVLRGLSAIVLEISAKKMQEGVDVSKTLSSVTQVLQNIALDVRGKEMWTHAVEGPDSAKNLDSKIWAASESLELELKKLLQGEHLEKTSYRNELVAAQQEDQKKIRELKAIIEREARPGTDLYKLVQQSMEENLKIVRDPTVQQQHQQVDAKRALAVLAELTGTSLPPATLLGKDFVTIGAHSIHSSASFEIFHGRYFTGEEIAVKQLRHRVDEDTAKRTHERFARQALNWSSLRHDAILPFYGVGVVDSLVARGEVQLYLVSPYLQNQDVRRYLRKYPGAPLSTRMQMILDVARGLHHMHEAVDLPEPGNGIVHSALNIFNILIKDSGRAVISGFGQSKIIREDAENFTGDNSEYRYMAPEMMHDDARVTHGTDIWSWAMTSIEILTDVPPFGEKAKGPKLVTLLAQHKRPLRSDHPRIEEYKRGDELWTLFERCLNEDPWSRPTADEIVQLLKPMVKELGRKNPTVVQSNDPQGPYGQVPEGNELGKPNQPIVPGSPPERPPAPPQQYELGKSSSGVGSGVPPKP